MRVKNLLITTLCVATVSALAATMVGCGTSTPMTTETSKADAPQNVKCALKELIDSDFTEGMATIGRSECEGTEG